MNIFFYLFLNCFSRLPIFIVFIYPHSSVLSCSKRVVKLGLLFWVDWFVKAITDGPVGCRSPGHQRPRVTDVVCGSSRCTGGNSSAASSEDEDMNLLQFLALVSHDTHHICMASCAKSLSYNLCISLQYWSTSMLSCRTICIFDSKIVLFSIFI